MPEAVTTSRTGGQMVERPGRQKAERCGGERTAATHGRPGPFHLLLVPPLSRKFREALGQRGSSVRLFCRCPPTTRQRRAEDEGTPGGGVSARDPLVSSHPAHPSSGSAHSSHSDPAHFSLAHPPVSPWPCPFRMAPAHSGLLAASSNSAKNSHLFKWTKY